MHLVRRLLLPFLTFAAVHTAPSQTNRIFYNHQQLFLSGANLAWVNFASDIGSGHADLPAFADIQLQIHENGGNAMRWWLHTDGTVTPAFDDSGFVIGPGTGTIADIRAVLDSAWEREIGVDLCLWSFDMLRSTNGPIVLNRNMALLTDTGRTKRYIDSCLIPMVKALKGHPAIIAWEIFNEPEGMSNEFGWSDIRHVPMSAIQRFINLCAGAIHRTDPAAQVTSGSWSFKALTDVPVASLAKAVAGAGQLATAEKLHYAAEIGWKYRLTDSPVDILHHLETVAGTENYNYYSDSRLIAAGGDTGGILDFYSVHYYTGIDPINPTSISPFHHPWSAWGLSKPIVVAEFAMQNTLGVLTRNLFETLFQTGYAGALPWSWTDVNISSHADMLAAMYSMWVAHRSAVDLLGGGHETIPALPATWLLEQNFPNPFNSGTVIRFQVPEPSDVRLGVFDLLGREVAVLVNEEKQGGAYAVPFDGRALASGVYLFRLQGRALRSAGGGGALFVQSRKMAILR